MDENRIISICLIISTIIGGLSTIGGIILLNVPVTISGGFCLLMCFVLYDTQKYL